MKFIFIYGPPASGKLTVGKELSNKTGYKLFHNHLTIELAKEIFIERIPERLQLVNKLRLDVFEAAAKANVNMIFTFVYAHHEDDYFVHKVIEIIKGNGGEIHFVQLIPPRAVLTRRINDDSRKTFSKIKDRETLNEILNEHDLVTPIDNVDNLSIDNSEISPTEVAEKIVSYFSL